MDDPYLEMIMNPPAEKPRYIQEFVPGKQITLAHLIAHPKPNIFKKLGIQGDFNNAIGIMTITPSEGAIIAADSATKAADIEVAFVDRFNGSVVIAGNVGSVQSALETVIATLKDILNFAPCPITRT